MESKDIEVKVDAADMAVEKLLGFGPVFLLLVIVVLRISWMIYYSSGQKTRNTQQRRYAGTRTRQQSVQEPTIFVSPSNMPPPPKYESMEPPSYEEVIGIQYPNYSIQPITYPLTHGLAQGSSSTAGTTSCNATNVVNTVTTSSNNAANNNVTNVSNETPELPTVVTVNEESRTTVTARS